MVRDVPHKAESRIKTWLQLVHREMVRLISIDRSKFTVKAVSPFTIHHATPLLYLDSNLSAEGNFHQTVVAL